MRGWKPALMISAVTAAVLVPLPASAAGVVSCDLGGNTPTRGVVYVNCDLGDSAPSGEQWLGIHVVSGQGTSAILATCVLGSLPYTVHVNYTNAGAPTSASTPLNCTAER